MRKTRAASEARVRFRDPIEPRFTIQRTYGLDARTAKTVRVPVICPDCEAAFAGRWYPNGEPVYVGGWRTARQRDRATGLMCQVSAPCRCPVGMILSGANPRVPPVPAVYYPNAQMPSLLAGDEWEDPRDVRPISDDDLADWRQHHQTANDVPVEEPDAGAGWMQETL